MSDKSLAETIIEKSSRGHGKIAISAIYVSEERIRKDSNEVTKHIESLATSIADKGLIQPPTLFFPDEPIEHNGVIYEAELIAGGCRLNACKLLGLEEIPYNSTAQLTPDQKLELELEENELQLQMTWQDRTVAICNIHKKKKAQHGAKGEKWGLVETGRLVGASTGHVSDLIKFAELIKQGDGEIIACSGINEAKRVLAGRGEDALIKSLTKNALPAPAKRSGDGPVVGQEQKQGIKAEPTKGIDLEKIAQETSSPNENVNQHMVESLTVDLSQMLFNMPNEEWFAQQPDASVNLVYTDIPYGIEMDNLDYDAADLDRVADEHDVDENIEQMAGFLKNAYRVLKDDSYCVFWYDIKHQEKLHQWALDAGFSVQPYPLIWCKTHTCRNRAAGTWWTKSIEYVFVCRKGKGTLRQARPKCYFEADGRAERNTQRNPFSKPFAVSREIIETLTIQGDVILDCYAGEGSIVRCALTMGRKILAVEKKPAHFERLTEHIKKVVSAMTRDKATFINE